MKQNTHRALIKNAVLKSNDEISDNKNCCGILELGDFVVVDGGLFPRQQTRNARFSAPSELSILQSARELLSNLEDNDYVVTGRDRSGYLVSSSILTGRRNTYWWFVKQVLLKLGFKEVNSFVNVGSGNKVLIMHFSYTAASRKQLMELASQEDENHDEEEHEEEWLD